jgi:hypothetical protein
VVSEVLRKDVITPCWESESHVYPIFLDFNDQKNS